MPMTREQADAARVLHKMWSINAEIDGIYSEIERYREIASKATSSFNATNGSGTATRSKVESAVCRIVDLEAKADGRISELIDLRDRIQDAIDQLPDQEATMLRLRFLAHPHKEWQDIAASMDMSMRSSYYKYLSALEHFSEVFFKKF